MKTTDEKLKPCPFCGGEAKELKDDYVETSRPEAYPEGGRTWIVCGCRAQHKFNTRAEAIAAWNTRSTDTSLLDRALAAEGEREMLNGSIADFSNLLDTADARALAVEAEGDEALGRIEAGGAVVMDAAFEAANGIIPIRLRHDLTVSIWGIPLDLTAAEAAKISAVVTALSVQPDAVSADARSVISGQQRPNTNKAPQP